MKLLDHLCAWLLVILGALHVVVMFTVFRQVTFSALWFFAAGLFIILAGLVNAVRAQGGRGTPLFRLTAIFTNCAVIAMGLIAMYLSVGALWRNPQVPAIFALGVAELLFTLRGR
jgi:asparagine N-glycosylation enzyme membrane subunit Stt3